MSRDGRLFGHFTPDIRSKGISTTDRVAHTPGRDVTRSPGSAPDQLPWLVSFQVLGGLIRRNGSCGPLSMALIIHSVRDECRKPVDGVLRGAWNKTSALSSEFEDQ